MTFGTFLQQLLIEWNLNDNFQQFLELRRVEVYDMSLAWAEDSLTLHAVVRWHKKPDMNQFEIFSSPFLHQKTSRRNYEVTLLILVNCLERARALKNDFFFCASSFDKGLKFNDSQVEHMLIIIELLNEKRASWESRERRSRWLGWEFFLDYGF